MIWLHIIQNKIADFAVSCSNIYLRRPVFLQNTLGARGFLREEPRSAIIEARSGEERENREEVRKPLGTFKKDKTTSVLTAFVVMTMNISVNDLLCLLDSPNLL